MTCRLPPQSESSARLMDWIEEQHRFSHTKATELLEKFHMNPTDQTLIGKRRFVSTFIKTLERIRNERLPVSDMRSCEQKMSFKAGTCRFTIHEKTNGSYISVAGETFPGLNPRLDHIEIHGSFNDQTVIPMFVDQTIAAIQRFTHHRVQP